MPFCSRTPTQDTARCSSIRSLSRNTRRHFCPPTPSRPCSEDGSCNEIAEAAAKQYARTDYRRRVASLAHGRVAADRRSTRYTQPTQSHCLIASQGGGDNVTTLPDKKAFVL